MGSLLGRSSEDDVPCLAASEGKVKAEGGREEERKSASSPTCVMNKSQLRSPGCLVPAQTSIAFIAIAHPRWPCLPTERQPVLENLPAGDSL